MNWVCCQSTNQIEENEFTFHAQSLQNKLNQNQSRSTKLIHQKTKLSSSKDLAINESNSTPTPTPSFFSNFFSFFIVSDCKYENHTNHPSPPLPGLHCDLLSNSIFLSQRPTNSLIEKYDLVNVFHREKIALIINLQMPYENMTCSIVQESFEYNKGFSYDSLRFSSEGIDVKHYGWNEAGNPRSSEFILNIIKEINNITANDDKKVFIHSHIGIGRTTLLYVCYLLYCDDSINTVKQALGFIQAKRPNAMLNDAQLQFCYDFKEYLRHLKTLFPMTKQSILYFLQNQIDINPTSRRSNDQIIYIPQIITTIFNRILILKGSQKVTKADIYRCLNGSYEINDFIIKALTIAISKLSSTNYEIIEECNNLIIIAEVLYCWLNTCVTSYIDPVKFQNGFRHHFDNEEIKALFHATPSDYPYKAIEIYSCFYNTFNKAEIELILFLANFLEAIPPETSNDKEEYALMIEKLSIYILGYDIDMIVNEGKDKKSIYRQTVKQMTFLLQFLTTYHSNDSISNGNRRRSSITLEKIFEKRRFSENINSLDKYFIMNNLNGTIGKNDEQSLYEMYSVLKKHFETLNEDANALASTSILKNGKKRKHGKYIYANVTVY